MAIANIYTFSPSPEWYEAPDLFDTEEEEEIVLPDDECLLVAQGTVRWCAAPDDEEEN